MSAIHIPGPADDQSVYILWQIFGNIIYFISGNTGIANGPTMVSEVISYFNAGLLSCLLLIYALIVVLGVIYTAHDGEILGRKWHTLWVVLRATFAPIAMIPVKFGFCLAQIILLYCVLVGVYLADVVWVHTTQNVDSGALPSVPVSLLNNVKSNVAQGVLYQAINQVQDDYGLSASDLEEVGTSTTSGNGSYRECNTQDADSQAVTNQFYRISGTDTPVLCVDTSSALPMNLLPNLVGSSGSVCDSETLGYFQTAMNWFYQGPIKGINGDDYTNSTSAFTLNTGLMVSQCNNAVQTSLTTSGSLGTNTYAYGFNVSSSSTPQEMDYKVQLGNSSNDNSSTSNSDSGDNNPTAEVNNNVATNGSITYQFNNMSYQPKDAKDLTYSQQAQLATQQIVSALDNDKNKQANIILNSYIADLNNTLITQSANSQSPQDITSSDFYAKCMGYLNNGALTVDYLNCINLNESGQTYSMLQYHGADSEPFSATDYGSYINSWWIGGESYLTVDKILNMNLSDAANILATNLAYPGLSINTQLHYTVPMSVTVYPSVNGSVIPNFHPRHNNSYEVNSSNNQISDPSTADYLNAMKMSNPSAGTTLISDYIPSTLKMGASDWAVDVYTYVPTPSVVPQGCDMYYGTYSGTSDSDQKTCENDYAVIQLQTNLMAFPPEMQQPFVYLFSLFGNTGSGTTHTLSEKIGDVKLLNNTLLFLQKNGIYQTTATTAVPVYAVIDKIFGELGGNDASTDITSIMNELYSLGLPSTSSTTNTSTAIYSTIMQAQQVGADIIQTVIDTLNNIFVNYQNQFSDMKSTAYSMIHKWAKKTIAISATTSFYGAGSLGTAFAIMGQTAVQLWMAAQIGNLAMSLAWMPIAIIILASLFTTAIAFSVMMPLIPYFLFWAGTIVWILSILEGLVAAPAVCLAVLFPGGHEIMGHGLPAIKIALNVIFRPVLMVIGITCAIALTYVLITYSAQGFHLVAPLILSNFSSSSMVSGIISCFLIFVYSSFMMMAFSKCFSVIYLIPDKVLEWIGAQVGSQRAGADEVQQLQGKTEQMSAQTGQAMGQGTQQGISAKQNETQSQVNAESQEIQVADKEGQTAGAEANKAQQAAAMAI
ncbi:conjugal transfer/type IV secretion protein DotA [Piscirickettsia salmonis]|uniref:Type IV secretion system protein DotA n=1 Tax=Piscirickettsia salmonis TaxID=1238 RepID=A0AAC8VJT1_PISSA|nr:DotA/TraY family protein [Piscirickettsia salmonis]ALB23843.1 type IV secretion system protein DotA [Piscirickettsia salmonis]QGO01163.1 conjugal transfer/type IV secretion protein DotA [Piscirickettsia salmonis]QGO18905.1 conjugal transfer/type IV secretion protein DotA [Piscirickettsia salmonis]QGO65591.1 conjugal transfer/type IV secretion protein DotA [Piscirickettsia salmonis]QGP14428.1 conjugal transfer/type IV secretion protein DotA [Piscirickettsia salmonis]